MDFDNPNRFFAYFGIPVFTYAEVLTASFLKISISNYLTIFSVRSKSFFFMKLPGIGLAVAGFASMTITTLICRFWFLNLQPKNSAIIANLSPIQ